MHVLSKPAGVVGGIATLMSMNNALRGPRICLAPPGEGGEGGGTKSVTDLAAEIKSDHQKAFDKVKEIAEQALGEAKSSGVVANKTKEAADEALLKMNGLTEQIATLEQKLARRPGEGSDRPKSIGEQFVESEDFQKSLNLTAKKRGAASIELKATLTSANDGNAGSVGAAIQTTRLPGIQALPQRRMTVRDLISPGQMDGASLEYVQETGFTNNAGMVAEGTAKPSSEIKLELKNTSAKVIAHWMKASRQVLDDIPALRSIIDQRLLYGLDFKEEGQILNGDGAGQNLHGIIPQASPYAAPIAVAGATSIDVMRLAMLQAVLAEYPATGHVMHPIDWAWIETLKDGQGRYIIGNPQGTVTPTLWGLPVVQTQAIEQDKFLTGAFKLGAQVFDRWQSRVEVATENEDDFIKNLITVLAEERLALAVYRPEAFVYGDFGRVA